MKPETACIHAARHNLDNAGADSSGAVVFPIYQSATFAHPGFGKSTGYDYSRTQNPSVEHTETLLASLEHGAGASAFASGMAAISALMELFSPGDEVIATDDLYGGSIRLFNTISAKNGLNVRYVNTSDLADVESAITDATKALFIETPTNPMMNVSDIAEIKSLIGERNILLIVDNTFLTPYFFNPIDLGADVVIHSGTKYLSGHNDTLAGFLVSRTPELAERIYALKNTIGAILSPFDAFLVSRGIKTLAIRMEKSQQNAMTVARWLKEQQTVKETYYVGLPDHPAYHLSQRQSRGFGAMISFRTDSEETARHILNNTALIHFAESLGGVETLITYPLTQTHADVPESQRLARGIDGTLLRLSVGIEAVDDIIDDLQQAIDGSR